MSQSKQADSLGETDIDARHGHDRTDHPEDDAVLRANDLRLQLAAQLGYRNVDRGDLGLNRMIDLRNLFAKLVLRGEHCHVLVGRGRDNLDHTGGLILGHAKIAKLLYHCKGVDRMKAHTLLLPQHTAPIQLDRGSRQSALYLEPSR